MSFSNGSGNRWGFDVSARAIRQAVTRTVRVTTNEGKPLIMAKTLRSRIAAVAVAALGMGVLSAAPSSAAAVWYLSAASVTAGTNDASGNVPVLNNAGVYQLGATVRVTVNYSGSDVVQPTAIITSVPTGQRATGNLVRGASSAVTSGLSTSATFTYASSTDDKAGSYGITIFDDANKDGSLTTGESSVVYSFKLGGAIADAVITPADGSTVVTGQSVRYTVTLVDAAGNATVPLSNDLKAVNLVATGAANASAANTNILGTTATATNAQTTTVNLFKAQSAASFANGVTAAVYGGTAISANAGVQIAQPAATFDAAAGVFRFTGASTGATAKANTLSVTYDGTALTTTNSVTVVADQSSAAGTTLVATPGQTGVYYAAATPTAITVDKAVSTVNFSISGGTAGVALYTTAISTGFVGGGLIPGTSQVLIGADGVGSFSVTVPTPSSSVKYTVALGSTTLTITYVTPTPSFFLDLSNASTASFTAKAGDSSVINGTVLDQLKRPVASAAITVASSGRNVATASLTTDANGRFSYTQKDLNTSTDFVTFGTDTVTFTHYTSAGVARTATATITYSATGQAVATVVVTAVESAASGKSIWATAAADTTTDGYVVVDPFSAVGTTSDEVVYTATVRDANGLPLQYVPVTFSGSADDLFVSGINQGITNANGVATATVYRTKIGTATITATAGGKSGALSSKTWVTDEDYARNIALTASPATTVAGGVINAIATVTDRFGNPVPNITVTFSSTGVGRFVQTNNQVATNSSGRAQIQVQTLATETGDVNVVGAFSGAQSADVAGYVVTTAVAGVTAGNGSSSVTGKFTAAPAPAADPSITALTKAVSDMMTALQNQIAAMQSSITLLVTSFSSTVTKLLNALAKKK